MYKGTSALGFFFYNLDSVGKPVHVYSVTREQRWRRKVFKIIFFNLAN